MKNIPLLIITVVATLALIIGVAAVFSQGGSSKPADQTLVLGDARNAKGPTTAKVTIVEFSDLQCPACLASQPYVQEVLTKYPNEVRFIYRHFPLVSIHPHAQQAALAAEAAAEQGKFWELHDKLFETQTEWTKLSKSEDFTKQLEVFAAELGIDKAKFLERIQTEEVKQRVAQDVADGTKAGVNATPTFYVDGQPVPAPDLLKTVETRLSATP